MDLLQQKASLFLLTKLNYNELEWIIFNWKITTGTEAWTVNLVGNLEPDPTWPSFEPNLARKRGVEKWTMTICDSVHDIFQVGFNEHKVFVVLFIKEIVMLMEVFRQRRQLCFCWKEHQSKKISSSLHNREVVD